MGTTSRRAGPREFEWKTGLNIILLSFGDLGLELDLVPKLRHVILNLSDVDCRRKRD